MDRDNLFHNEGRRFSRRMVLKLLGWFTVAVGMVKIPGMGRAQEKLEIISEFVRFPGKGVTLGGFFARPGGGHSLG